MGGEPPRGWGDTPLPDAIDFREGPGILAKDFRSAGVPLIRLAGLGGGDLLRGCNYLDPTLTEQKWSHFQVAAGDTLLSTSASLGRVARVPEWATGAIPYTGLIRMRPRDDRLTADYIPYLLQDPAFKRQVEAMGAGSVMRHFGPSHLRQMTVRIPPVSEQVAIAQVLAVFDDKIENNRQLRAIDQRTLGAWFRALVDSALGQEPVSSLAVEVRTRVRPADRRASTFEQFSIPAFDAGRGPEVCVGGDMASTKTLLPDAPVVLISKLNPATKRVWWPERLDVGIPVCSPEFVALSPCDPADAAWLYGCAAFDQRFYEHVLAAVTGTTGSRQRVKPADVMSAVVPVVEADQRGEWAALARPVLARRVVLLRESRILTAIRDALLPKLVSGQIRVPLSNDPDEQVGAAVEALA